MLCCDGSEILYKQALSVGFHWVLGQRLPSPDFPRSLLEGLVVSWLFVACSLHHHNMRVNEKDETEIKWGWGGGWVANWRGGVGISETSQGAKYVTKLSENSAEDVCLLQFIDLVYFKRFNILNFNAPWESMCKNYIVYYDVYKRAGVSQGTSNETGFS